MNSDKHQSGGRILCLDVGDKHTGVAISDALGLIAHELPVLLVSSSEELLFAIKKIIDEYQPVRIVIGLPLSLKGEVGQQAEKVKVIGQRIEETMKIPVVFQDERYTSREAKKLIQSSGVTKKLRRRLQDSISAQLILQSYLDSKP